MKALRRRAPDARAEAHGLEREWVELVSELARHESPSEDPEAQGPVLDLLGSRFEDLGLAVRRLPGRASGGQLLARPRGERPRGPFQLLLGHCDTVWPRGTLRKMPVERDGAFLRGPGVYDMKAGLAQMVYALEILRRLEATPEMAPVVFINSDEEIGSPESRRYLRRLARVAQRVWVLEPSLGPEGRIKTARKGVGHFTVRIVGKASHAGLAPEEGASAIRELGHVLQELFALNDPERGISVNVGTVDGGLRSNVVAAESRAEVDVRVLTLEDGETVDVAIRSLRARTPGVRLEVSGGIGRPPLEPTPRNRRLWRLARELGAAMGLELQEGTAGGGSDGNFTSRYAATLDGLGAVGGGAHAAHEHVDVEPTLERTALLALLLQAPCQAATRPEAEDEVVHSLEASS